MFGPVTGEGAGIVDEVTGGLEDTVFEFDEFVELVEPVEPAELVEPVEPVGLFEPAELVEPVEPVGLATAADAVLVVVLVSIVTSSDVVPDELDGDAFEHPANSRTHKDITVSSETNFKCFMNTLLFYIIII